MPTKEGACTWHEGPLLQLATEPGRRRTGLHWRWDAADHRRESQTLFSSPILASPALLPATTAPDLLRNAESPVVQFVVPVSVDALTVAHLGGRSIRRHHSLVSY